MKVTTLLLGIALFGAATAHSAVFTTDIGSEQLGYAGGGVAVTSTTYDFVVTDGPGTATIRFTVGANLGDVTARNAVGSATNVGNRNYLGVDSGVGDPRPELVSVYSGGSVAETITINAVVLSSSNMIINSFGITGGRATDIVNSARLTGGAETLSWAGGSANTDRDFVSGPYTTATFNGNNTSVAFYGVVDAVGVPEPTSLGLLALSACGLIRRRRR